jgi:putative PIN family toxin of toxin-antitoxin system
MRVVLDSNVLLSAFIRVDSKPYKLVRAWLDGRFELVSSAEQLEELTRASRYPRLRQLLEPAEVGWLVNRIRERALMVQRLPDIDVANDPADNFLLAMANKAGAEYIVTGDKAGLLTLKQHGVTRLVGVSEMVTALKLR